MVEFTNLSRLSEEEFKKFSKLIYDESGIFMKDAKITLLSNRLRKRLKILNLNNFSEYYNYIQTLSNKSMEIQELIDVVSTNETYFFRNERHFQALLEYCLPEISNRKKDIKRLRIWSSASSTGEEPYTIAITVLEKRNLFPGWKIEIIATDIAPSVLEFAKKGEYSGRRIEKIPPNILSKYFIQKKVDDCPDIYIVKNELKKIVQFSVLNLFKNSFPNDLDVIFCRNVMIYFDKDHQKELVSGFRKVISDDGYLFIGHSETIYSISDEFIYKKILEAPVYVIKR